MWPWVIWSAAAAAGSALLAAAFSSQQESQPATDRPGILERNLSRLGGELARRPQRVVAILGQPGAGKSSLLNSLSGGRCTPPPKIGQETDATDWSSDPRTQLISQFDGLLYLDTPGYGTRSHPASIYSSRFPFSRCHLVFFVLGGKVRESDDQVFRRIVKRKPNSAQLIVVRNFDDALDDRDRGQIREDLNRRFGAKYEIVFTSSRSRAGIETLRGAISSIPHGPEASSPPPTIGSHHAT